MIGVSREDEKDDFGDLNRPVISITVRAVGTNEKLGESRVFVDELIDTNLRDLSQEHALSLSREQIYQDKKLQLVSSGMSDEDAKKNLIFYAHYAGIVTLRTLFRPSKDTALRFAALNASDLTSWTPMQLLHYELLLEKSDYDN